MIDCKLIYVIDESKKNPDNFWKIDNNKVVVGSFKAKDREDAAKYVDEYNKEHTDRTYYYMQDNGVYVHNPDGTNTYNSDFLRKFDIVNYKMRKKLAPYKLEWKQLRKSVSKRGDVSVRVEQIVKKIAHIRKFYSCNIVKLFIRSIDSISDFFGWYCYGFWEKKFNDFNHERKRIRYFKKHYHDIQEPWSLDTHMLNDLKWNLKRLKEESQGYPTDFLLAALKEYHKDDKDWDDSNWYRETNEDVEKMALQLRNKVYDDIIHHIDLYYFYTNSMDDDDNLSDDMTYIYYPNTFDCVNWDKMGEIAKKNWDEIWELVKIHGQGMWD